MRPALKTSILGSYQESPPRGPLTATSTFARPTPTRHAGTIRPGPSTRRSIHGRRPQTKQGLGGWSSRICSALGAVPRKPEHSSYMGPWCHSSPLQGTPSTAGRGKSPWTHSTTILDTYPIDITHTRATHILTTNHVRRNPLPQPRRIALSLRGHASC